MKAYKKKKLMKACGRIVGGNIQKKNRQKFLKNSQQKFTIKKIVGSFLTKKLVEFVLKGRWKFLEDVINKKNQQKIKKNFLKMWLL